MQRVIFRLGYLCVLGLGLAACADQQKAPVAAAVVVAPSGPVAVDGVYQGYAALTEAGASEEMLCGTNVPLTLTVTGRSFAYVLTEPQVSYAPVKRFLVQIGPDGSFTSQSGAARLQGKVAGKALSGDAFGEACNFHFDTSRP